MLIVTILLVFYGMGRTFATPESITDTIELAKHYNPDMAFFLAIAPWPYAELYPEL